MTAAEQSDLLRSIRQTIGEEFERERFHRARRRMEALVQTMRQTQPQLRVGWPNDNPFNSVREATIITVDHAASPNFVVAKWQEICREECVDVGPPAP